MRFSIRKKASSSSSSKNNRPAADGNGPASSPAASAAVADCADGGGGEPVIASPDRNGAQNGGSKDELFFETRPWLDSDSEDDFYSIRGDFTPSRGSTPDHQMQASFGARMSAGRSEPKLIEKKQKLIELLQEKQLFDDEQEGSTDADSETGMSSIVYAEEHLKKSSGKAEKAKRSPKAGCFPSSTWRLGSKSFWKRKNEKKNK